MVISKQEMQRQLIEAGIAGILLEITNKHFWRPQITMQDCTFEVVKPPRSRALSGIELRITIQRGGVFRFNFENGIGPTKDKTQLTVEQLEIIHNIAAHL